MYNVRPKQKKCVAGAETIRNSNEVLYLNEYEKKINTNTKLKANMYCNGKKMDESQSIPESNKHDRLIKITIIFFFSVNQLIDVSNE